MHYITIDLIEDFRQQMIAEEKSASTISKYIRDVKAFAEFVSDLQPVTKELVIAYKEHLREAYRLASVNSMLAALDHFFHFARWDECIVKIFKIQRESFRGNNKELTKAEYIRLINAARKCGRERLALLMETICATGIRVSELQFVTVDAVKTGKAEIYLKGKNRAILLPEKLRQKLKKYIRQAGVKAGAVFVTRGGRPLDRSNILHEMKALGEAAQVDRDKIFPHNLRHLFALTYYRIEKDLAHLADILGHSNVNTTRIYTACSSGEQLKVMSRMGFVT